MERLDKLIASQGMYSRKDVKALIQKGNITVNGQLEKNYDTKVNETDIICIKSIELKFQKYLYLMLNKPKGYISAVQDSKDKTVLELVPSEYRRKNLFPAGRLDKDTTGLLIITDDGILAHDILSPKNHIKKSYLVEIDIPITSDMIETFTLGVKLNDGICKPAELEILSQFKGIVTLTEGKYHQIKRMFGCSGAKVTNLKRISMGSLILDENLQEGDCRPLSEDELLKLKS